MLRAITDCKIETSTVSTVAAVADSPPKCESHGSNPEVSLLPPLLGQHTDALVGGQLRITSILGHLVRAETGICCTEHNAEALKEERSNQSLKAEEERRGKKSEEEGETGG